jgi:anti-anti-sigma regulatory factor
MTIALTALDDRPPAGVDGDPPGDGGRDSDDDRAARASERGGSAGRGDPRRGLRYEVAGRLDAEASHEVRGVERTPGPDTVVEIDLENCEGMDDFGFGSLVGLIRRARENNARVRVRADAEVRDELERTGVARLVDVVPTGSGR